MSAVPRTGRKCGLGAWSPARVAATGMQTQATENEHNSRVTRHTLVNRCAGVVSRLGAPRRRAHVTPILRWRQVQTDSGLQKCECRDGARMDTRDVPTERIFRRRSHALVRLRQQLRALAARRCAERASAIVTSERVVEVVEVVQECPNAAPGLWMW
ncbi:hypothetical protein EXIGLDRAFT_318658 [Exidia glandulosa HHB12029]|uniref:Uncharacterized protein n=1 Tax=Exidia glandulosa HHB12029 TaxID=1314781 RepID=A0A165Q2Z4_EXIGL|nr:hypothetical protein EXIGLDRAFT_318658 [Exidia glandulosa HHB12029]